MQAYVSQPPGYALHNRQSEHTRPRPPLARSNAVSAGLRDARTTLHADGLNPQNRRAAAMSMLVSLSRRVTATSPLFDNPPCRKTRGLSFWGGRAESTAASAVRSDRSPTCSSGCHRAGAAFGARPNQNDLVVTDAEALRQPVSEPGRTLARNVIHAIALIAPEVVVVGQPCQFVSAGLPRQFDRTDQPALGKSLERAVDRGQIDRRRLVLGQVENLSRAQRPLGGPERCLDRDAL